LYVSNTSFVYGSQRSFLYGSQPSFLLGFLSLKFLVHTLHKFFIQNLHKFLVRISTKFLLKISHKLLVQVGFRIYLVKEACGQLQTRNVFKCSFKNLLREAWAFSLKFLTTLFSFLRLFKKLRVVTSLLSLSIKCY
jgi:hypothetical protein